MKTPSFKSLASMLLAGALSVPVTGCGPEGAADDDTTVQTGALIRMASSVDVEVTSVESATPIKTIKTVTATLTPATPAAPAPGTDFERNHPWSVFITGTGGLSCRGTLIHPLWVLTAAHCIGPIAGSVAYQRTDPVTGVVSSGSRPFNQSGPQRGMFVHPDFELDTGFGQPKNDIALIRLATPFTIDRNIQTAALPRLWANPGRIGTIATNNHSNAPAGYVSIVRTPQLTDDECTSPDGFICISPPAGSMCGGDSGSGFVEILDGRATVVGVTSNVDSDGSDCIAANNQAQLADVYAYRGWIYATMGMSPEQVDGRVRLRWSGLASQPGIMSLQCLSATMPAIEVPMNIPGSEIAMDCDDTRVFCQPQGANLNLYSFTQRTFAANGTYMGTQALPFLPTFTAAFADPASSFLGLNCAVYNSASPALPLTTTGTIAKASF
jgi:hypothetical protein